MDYGFWLRLQELRHICASTDVVYVTTSREMPGAAANIKEAGKVHVLGTFADSDEKLYRAWLDT